MTDALNFSYLGPKSWRIKAFHWLSGSNQAYADQQIVGDTHSTNEVFSKTTRFQSMAFSLASFFFQELQCLATRQVECDDTGFATLQHQLFFLATRRCYYTCSALLPPIAFLSSHRVNTCKKSISYYNYCNIHIIQFLIDMLVM